MRRLTPCCALVAVLLATPAALAANIATVVVFDPTGDDRKTGEEITRDAWLQQFGVDASVRFVPVETVLPGDEPVVLLGDGQVEACLGGPVDAAGFAEAAAAVSDQVEMMEYLEAAGAMARAEAMLPCLSEAPPPESLARHHFLRGIVAWYAEGPEEAVDRFEEGLLASPFLQWDERFPPPIRPTFHRAVTSALAAGTAFLSLSPSVVSQGRLWLDGLEVDPRTRTTSLFEGTHLVQWQPTGGSLRSWSVHVGDGQSLDLVHRNDALEELLAGRASDVLTQFTRERVLAPVEREAGGRLFVAQPWEVTLFHEFDASSGQWWLADIDVIEDHRKSGRQIRGGGIALSAIGIGSMVVGGIITVDGLLGADLAHERIYKDGEFHLDSGIASGTLATFNANIAAYNRFRTQANVGLVVSVGGGAMVMISVPMVIDGERRSRATGLHRIRGDKRSRPVAESEQKQEAEPDPEPEP